MWVPSQAVVTMQGTIEITDRDAYGGWQSIVTLRYDAVQAGSWLVGAPGGGGGPSTTPISNSWTNTGASRDVAVTLQQEAGFNVNYSLTFTTTGAPHAGCTLFDDGAITDEEVWGWGDPEAQRCVADGRGEAGRGVDTASGNFVYSMTDFAVPSRGEDLSLTRTYNAGRRSMDGPFGFGWTASAGASIAQPDPATAVVTMGGGSTATFKLVGSTWVGLARTTATLLRNADNTWRFTSGKRTKYNFSTAGKLTSIVDLNQYAMSFGYDTSSRLATITDSSARTLTFAYSGTATRVSSVTDFTGRVATFTYSPAGDLTDVVDVRGGRWQLGYDASHRLQTVRSPRYFGDTATTPSPVMTTHYDGNGRVDWQSDEIGRTTTLDYTTVPGSTRVTDPKGHVRMDTYTDGALTAQTPGYGTSSAATTTFGYSRPTACGSRSTNALAQTSTSTHDADGNVLTTTDALNNTTTFTYTSLNDVATKQEPTLFGAVRPLTTYQYDAAGNLLSESTPLLNAAGVTTATRVTSHAYADPAKPGDETSMTDPTAKVWSYTYDSDGNKISETDPEGNKTTHTYDRLGRRASTVTPKGNVTGGTPDAYRSATLPDNGGLEVLTVDAAGKPIIDTFSRGNATTGLGVTATGKTWQALSGTWGISGGRGYAVSATSKAPAFAVVPAYADGTFSATLAAAQLDVGIAFRATSTTNHWRLLASPSTSTWKLVRVSSGTATTVGTTGTGTCCTVGQQVAVTTSGSTITVKIDGVAKLTTTSTVHATAPNAGLYAAATGVGRLDNFAAYGTGAGVTSKTFDAAGTLSTATDPEGRTTTYTHDPALQLTRETRADATYLEYGYDLNGNRTSSRDGAGQTATKAFADPAFTKSVTSEVDRVTRTTTSEYDRAGNLYRVTDPSGRSTTNGYDAANRRTSTDYSDPATPDVTSVGYDANGRRTSMVDGTGTSTWAWDSLGRMTSSTNGAAQTSTFGYDLAGRTTTIAYPNAVGTVTRTYDNAGRLKTVTDWLNNTTTYTPDPNGNPATKTLPTANGLIETTAFDNNDRATNITHKKGATTLASFAYTRTPGGRVATTTPTGVGQLNETYTYNSLNQLSQTNANTYTYSNAGDLTKHLDGIGQSHDAASQLCWTAAAPAGTCAAPPASATTYSYDPQGNRTDKLVPGSPSTTYAYDQANRLTAAAPANRVVVSGGTAHGVSVKTDGTVWGWGYNNGGQVGDNTTISRSTPVQAIGITDVTAVEAGGLFTLARKSDGTVWGWGEGYYGQLGHGGSGNSAARLTPQQVPGVTGATAVSAGWIHSLAVKSDGTVWGWGGNDTGALGDGTKINKLTPIQIPGLTGVVAVSAGGYHSLALKSDGTVWAWGAGSNGQLGNGAWTGSTTPLQVPVTGVTAIAAGYEHSVALKADGTVTAWGSNYGGSLGDGTNFYRNTPAPVINLPRTTAIAAGDYHTLAVGADRTLRTWGANYNGQLGDGTTTNRWTPTSITTIGATSAIAGGGDFSLAVSSGGSIFGAGSNVDGRLGDGTTINRSTMTPTLAPPAEAATATYRYNGDGLRVAKAVSGSSTQHAWDDSRKLPLMLIDGSDAYIYGESATPIARIRSGTPTWIHADQLGSVRLLTSAAGVAVGTYSYDPYGKVTSQTGSESTVMQYTGQYFDAETGLTYLRARHYDAQTGAFLQTDPIEGGSANDYDYCRADPLNCLDLDGMWGRKNLGKWWRAHGSTAIMVGGIALGALACVSVVGCMGVAAAVGAVSVSNSAVQHHYVTNRHLRTMKDTRAFQTDAAFAVFGVAAAGLGVSGARAITRAGVRGGLPRQSARELFKVSNVMIAGGAGGMLGGWNVAANGVVNQ